jgi:hypothetical protein
MNPSGRSSRRSGSGQARTGPARLARRSHTLQDNWDDSIPTLMREAGLGNATETGQLTKHIGRLTYYRATRVV